MDGQSFHPTPTPIHGPPANPFFTDVRVSQVYNPSDFNWPEYIERAEAARDDSGTEKTGVMTDQLRVTPVRTFLSHLLVNADCVVDVLAIVRDAEGVRFREDVLPAVANAFADLERLEGENLLIRIRYSRNVKQELDDSVNDIPGRKEFARKLGFQLCNFLRSQIAESEEVDELEAHTAPINVFGRALVHAETAR